VVNKNFERGFPRTLFLAHTAITFGAGVVLVLVPLAIPGSIGIQLGDGAAEFQYRGSAAPAASQ